MKNRFLALGDRGYCLVESQQGADGGLVVFDSVRVLDAHEWLSGRRERLWPWRCGRTWFGSVACPIQSAGECRRDLRGFRRDVGCRLLRRGRWRRRCLGRERTFCNGLNLGG